MTSFNDETKAKFNDTLNTLTNKNGLNRDENLKTPYMNRYHYTTELNGYENENK